MLLLCSGSQNYYVPDPHPPARGSWGFHFPCHRPAPPPAACIRAEHLWEAVRTSEKRLHHPSARSQARGAQTIPTLASSDLPRASLPSTSCGGPQDRPPTRTQAHSSRARSTRQPIVFRPDLQKESHGTDTFLLVPLRALCFPEVKSLPPEPLSVSVPCSVTKLLSLGTCSCVMNLANNFKMTNDDPARAHYPRVDTHCPPLQTALWSLKSPWASLSESTQRED